MARKGLVHIVDDDDAMRDSLAAVLEETGFEVRTYSHAEEFMALGGTIQSGCVVSDVRMPGMDGLTLLRRLRGERSALPVVLITGHGDVPLAVAAMKAGAVDFLEKPFDTEQLLDVIQAALQTPAGKSRKNGALQAARRQLEALTPREREVFECLVAGNSNKEAANKLGLSPRTVEFHRAHIMEKTAAKGLPDLVRLWLTGKVPQSPK